MKIRRATLALLVLVVFTLGAQFAFASNPSTSLGGCMKAWTPYTVASGANTIMQAHSYNSGCYGGAFRNCLERSSWSGYVKVRCNAWHLTSEIHDEKVSGCLKGTYDYHTFQDYAAPDGQTHFWLYSEARKAYKCLVTV